MDQWDLGEEEESESQYNELQETILIQLKASKGREEKRPRFVQFMLLAVTLAIHFHSLYNLMHVAKYSQLELIDCL